jgi:hypothetical protein
MTTWWSHNGNRIKKNERINQSIVVIKSQRFCQNPDLNEPPYGFSWFSSFITGRINLLKKFIIVESPARSQTLLGFSSVKDKALAIPSARVVFPDPSGPQKTIRNGRLARIPNKVSLAQRVSNPMSRIFNGILVG